VKYYTIHDHFKKLAVHLIGFGEGAITMEMFQVLNVPMGQDLAGLAGRRTALAL
jgi:hypothetical protein